MPLIETRIDDVIGTIILDRPERRKLSLMQSAQTVR